MWTTLKYQDGSEKSFNLDSSFGCIRQSDMRDISASTTCPVYIVKRQNPITKERATFNFSSKEKSVDFYQSQKKKRYIVEWRVTYEGFHKNVRY